ncbi:MAG TPA: glycoside hydrolase family 2 protein [Polyangia bacterium]|nr:glycoside hydrolase family 2 protein [Polyangia bacterium]
MTGRVRSVTGHEVLALADWRACATPPGAADGPRALDAAAPPSTWTAAPAPGTAAAMLRAAGAFDLETSAPRRFDAEDWWFRARVPSIVGEAGVEHALVFEGLATVADVWLDDALVLSSGNMFRRHEVKLAPSASPRTLTIRCRALDPLLKPKAPRAAWRVPMIENQHLRWFRTTLLGRTPGWSPPVAAVGPWRPVTVARRAGVTVDDVRLATRVRDGRGVVEVSLAARAPSGELVVARDGREHRARLAPAGDRLTATVEVPDAALWWPHTHGEPALYAARVELAGGVTVDLGAVGFRTITREPGDGFGLRVNDVPIFCRGACWTPPDPVALAADRATLARAIGQARRAGMNMLRVGGTMVYESDDFYDLCDEHGVLVWQDFMFANMDYPAADAAFAADVAVEARDFLARVQARPSLAVLCGNSEGEQQAAMWGAPRERWSQPLFADDGPLFTAARTLTPDVPTWPSSAHGGAFPHEARVGTTSYYGVGAYLRPLDDARRAEVAFASECLAFANVPDAGALAGGPGARVHHAAWKARTPRDLGAGWDFDDVRDHYVERLFGVDVAALRYADHDRFLALGRVATGEVMAQTFGEWRRARSTCRGGLVWFLRDFWKGAGWGVVDATGAPKAAWHYLRRALAPIAAHVSDEGGNGLAVHVCNDGAAALTGELEVVLYRAGEVRVAGAKRAIEVAPRAAVEIAAASLFDGFFDLSYAYRFGPPSHDLVVATVRAPAGGVVAEAFHFPVGLPATRELDVGLTAEVATNDDGASLVVKTKRFAQSIAVEVEGHEPDDAFFHLAPGATRAIALRRISGAGPTRGTLQPLNAETSAKIALP